MSEFKYWFDITVDNKEDLDHVLNILETKGIVPNTLMLDSKDQTPQADGLYHASLDTERLLPYGTSKGWDADDHDPFFHGLSLKFPAAMFEFRGVCIDDPQNNLFAKLYHNGLYKEVWQDNSDLSERLTEVSWRIFGEQEQEHTLKNDIKKIFVLVCTHETKFGTDAYVSLHPSWAAAEAHVENVKVECDYGEYGAGEYFNYDIKEHALDINTLESVQIQNKSSLSNVIAAAQTRSELQSKEGVPRGSNDGHTLG